MKSIKDKSYLKYQMDWMLRHISIGDLNDATTDWFNERLADLSVDLLFSDFLEEHGFCGCIWSCFDEFLEHEYKNREYMQYILSEEDFKEYLVDIGEGYVYYIDALNLVENCVQAGILHEYKSYIQITHEEGYSFQTRDSVAKQLMYDKVGRTLLTEALEKKESVD